MKHVKITLLNILIGSISIVIAQEPKDYIEFNDRKNIVHGIYIGISGSYGEIEGQETYISGFKVAYVANRKFEVGFVTKGIFSNQNIPEVFSSNTANLGSFYSGLHLEPIFFNKAKINLSFPVLIGGGAMGYINTEWNDNQREFYEENKWQAIFVVEPGVNILYNISRYVQLETGVKYRFSSKVKLLPDKVNRISGFSIGFGVKLGVFNLGRKRYKKNIQNLE